MKTTTNITYPAFACLALAPAAQSRDDINADGRINNQDVQAARSHRGESWP